MLWIVEHKVAWRLVLCAGLVAAIMGPWGFSSDGIGPTSRCAKPLILLEHDRCVRLVSGASIFAIVAAAFVQLSLDSVTGQLVLPARGGEFVGAGVFCVGALFLLLPIASTLIIVMKPEGQRLRVRQLVAWVLANVAALLLAALLGVPAIRTALWGAWLYVALAGLGLGMELLARSRRLLPVSGPQGPHDDRSASHSDTDAICGPVGGQDRT